MLSLQINFGPSVESLNLIIEVRSEVSDCFSHVEIILELKMLVHFKLPQQG